MTQSSGRPTTPKVRRNQDPVVDCVKRGAEVKQAKECHMAGVSNDVRITEDPKIGLNWKLQSYDDFLKSASIYSNQNPPHYC